MKIQKTDWGHIEWLYPDAEMSSDNTMRIGISSLLPGRRYNKHVHYGHEQFLYALEGQGIHYINDQELPFREGMYFYIEEGSVHDTLNTGDVPLRELLIANPKYFDTDVKINQGIKGTKFEDILYDSIEAIRVQLLESLSLPFTIFDNSWEVAFQSQNFPKFCTEQCNPRVNRQSTDCMIRRYVEGALFNNEREFQCKYGITVFETPIIYDSRNLGTIRGGHVLLSGDASSDRKDLYDTPESTIAGVKNLLQQISKSIVSYSEFISSKQLLMDRDRMLELSETKRVSLEHNLNQVYDIVTNLKINHHFLFNTLNAMASMALNGDSDRYDLYKSIINLSKMFRYTMETDLRFVKLASEIEYLNTYLDLQKLRYGEALRVNYELCENCIDREVPFNFLQPIVENAFIHGFLHYDENKQIDIRVDTEDDELEISVYNNGNTLNKASINRVNRNLRNGSRHGLSLIYQKLELAYGDDFQMLVESNGLNKTGVKTIIPASVSRSSDD